MGTVWIQSKRGKAAKQSNTESQQYKTIVEQNRIARGPELQNSFGKKKLEDSLWLQNLIQSYNNQENTVLA